MSDQISKRMGSGIAVAAVALCLIGVLVATVRVASEPGNMPIVEAALGLIAIGVAAMAVIVPWRTRLLRQQAVALKRQGSILEAAAFAAERLSLADGQTKGLDEALAHFGEATDASSIYVCENREDEKAGLVMSIVHEWVAAGVMPTIDVATNTDFPYANGFSHWEHELRLGHVVRSMSSDVGPGRADTDDEHPTSTLIVPISVSGAWWGFIGFDDRMTERQWGRAEVDALIVAAGTIGASIARARAVEEAIEAQERFRVLVEHVAGGRVHRRSRRGGVHPLHEPADRIARRVHGR